MNQTADARSGPLFNIFNSFIITLSSFFSNLFNITSSKERNSETKLQIKKYQSIGAHVCLHHPMIMLIRDGDMQEYQPISQSINNGFISFKTSITNLTEIRIYEKEKRILTLSLNNHFIKV